MNRFARWGFALALLPVAACADKPPAPPPAPPGPPPLAAADAQFIQDAAQGGMAEVQMAQLAQSKSKNPKVKAFAAKMIAEHSPNNDQLKQLATTKGATLPTGLSDAQNQQLTTLQGEMGRKFDHDYIADQVQDHQAMLTAFQTEAQSGTDPDLKNFASQTVPTIQEHLTDAQKLQTGGGTMHKGRHHKK
ncbi:DUF4142 domain-containing protein [Rhizosaccharibacter radicis]|uniref:DUF4142 domain-containing protein n=1 Tax=Rhizosaccharibacter radicis TaxID=2782605 RepID=A0ABT1W1P9_9PROT|nr:DUF4142 domain-containing protein [Acetobacteraceae bacterium KSS12]